MILNALLVTIYWASFPYVGLHLLSVLERRWKSKPISNDPLVRLFVGLCLGFAAFLPLALIGYAASLPIEPVSIFWALLFFMFLTRYRDLSLVADLFNYIKSKKYLWFFVGVLGVDYIVSLYVGGYFSGDAWGHIARINDILSNGFTIFDPYFPRLIDVRATTSLSHAFYATGASINGLEATEIWYLSLAFFRTGLAMSVYVVMKLLTRSRFLSAMTSVVTLIALSYDWRFVQYPNKLARIWLIYFVLGLIRILNNPNDNLSKLIIFSGAVLLALTHPVFSAGVAVLTVLTVLIHWTLTRRIATLRNYKWILATLSILVLPALFGSLVTTRGVVGLPQRGEVISLGLFEIINPTTAYTWTYLFAAIVVAYAFKSKRSNGFKGALIATILAYPLIAFTPIFPLLREFLSARIVQRYKLDTNFAIYSLWWLPAITIGAYWLAQKVKKFGDKLPLLVVVAITLVASLFYLSVPRKYLVNQSRLVNRAEDKIRSIGDIFSGLNVSKEEVVVSTETLSYLLPAVSNVSVVKIPDGHAARSADPHIRQRCLDELFNINASIRRGAILSLRPRYYAIDASTMYIIEIPELILIESSSFSPKYLLFEIDYEKIRAEDIGNYSASNSCEKVVNGEA